MKFSVVLAKFSLGVVLLDFSCFFSFLFSFLSIVLCSSFFECHSNEWRRATKVTILKEKILKIT